MYRKTSLLLAGMALLAIGAAALTARAAEDKKTPPAPKKPAEAKPAAGVLTPATLEKTLTDMGLEPKKVNDRAWDVKLSRDGWDFSIRISLTASGQTLWLTATLVQVGDINKVPAQALAKLLKGNFDYGPCMYYFFADPKKTGAGSVVMGRAIDNRGLTAALIRAELDRICTNVKSSHPLWKDLAKTAPVTSKLTK
jgi:hypothetical protein